MTYYEKMSRPKSAFPRNENDSAYKSSSSKYASAKSSNHSHFSKVFTDHV